MPKVVKSVALFFQEGNSDKVYEAAIVEVGPGVYTVEVGWGRRGAVLNKGTKAVKVTLGKAEAAFDKVVKEKQGKGYEAITGTSQPAAVPPPPGQGSGSKVASSGRKRLAQAAQLLVACEEKELERLLADATILAQPKLDGVRVLIHVGEEVVATNRSGQVTAFAGKELLAALAEAPRGTVIDGELVGAEYFAFDLLQHGTEDLRKKGYLDRYQELDALLDQLTGPLRLVPTAASEAEKRALLARLEKERGEGIVFKKRDAPYSPGRPSSGGAQLKWKFLKRAEVVITANAGNAYAMAVFDADGNERAIGKVFAGTTNQTRAELDRRLGEGERPVAEVEYLYATADDQLFQPVFLRVREDKEPEECGLDQLVHAGEAEAEPAAKKKKAH